MLDRFLHDNIVKIKLPRQTYCQHEHRWLNLISFQFWERRLILQTGVGGVSTALHEKFPTLKTLLFPLSLSLSLSFSLSPSLFTFLFLFPFLRSVFLFSIWSKDIERKKLTSNGFRTNTLIYCLSHVNLTFVFQKWYSGSCTWWEVIFRNLIFSFEVLVSTKKWSPVDRVKHTMHTHQHKFYHCCLPPYHICISWLLKTDKGLTRFGKTIRFCPYVGQVKS